MRRISLILLTALGCLQCLSTLYAGLDWESTKLEFTPKLGTESVSGEYRFTNAGKNPIKVLKVKTSCGCTSAALAKDTYEPGESGTIQVTMKLDPQGGLRRKFIYVYTNDPEHSEDRLIISAETQRVVTIGPRLLMWKNKEEMHTKTVRVRILIEDPVKVTNVRSLNPFFSVEWKVVTEGKEYEITVTPESTGKAVSGSVVVETDYPADSPVSYHVFARVLPAMR